MPNRIKECFVAFIDVLGFRDLIERDNGTGEYLQILKTAVSKGTDDMKMRKKELNHEYNFWYEEFKIKSFSDCFCFSIPLEFERGEKDYKQNLVAFYEWIMVFYNELLDNGFLCRGGITQGWHYEDSDIIFSKAQVEAYYIESKQAVYPLIMISSKLLSEINERNFANESYYNYMFAHDNAGRNFLNPFNYSIVDEMFFAKKLGDELLPEKKIRNMLLEKHLKTINEKIQSMNGQSHVDKYQWLKEFILYMLDNNHNDKFANGL